MNTDIIHQSNMQTQSSICYDLEIDYDYIDFDYCFEEKGIEGEPEHDCTGCMMCLGLSWHDFM